MSKSQTQEIFEAVPTSHTDISGSTHYNQIQV